MYHLIFIVKIKNIYENLLIWNKIGLFVAQVNPNNIEMATEKFNEISEAFEVLGDKQKRKQYDMFGNIN